MTAWLAVAVLVGGTPATADWGRAVGGDAGADHAAQASGGATWEIVSTPTERTLRGVDFVDEQHGWVVGGEGEHDEKCVMLRTLDGGDSWETLSCPFPLRLESVSFVDTRTGWAVGVQGLVIRTDDGGRNWVRQDAATSNKLTSVQFLDGRFGWISVAQAQFLLKTEDGGFTWQHVMLTEKEDLSYVHFLDADHGWALGGDGVLLSTTDAGASWRNLDYGSMRRMYALSFSDPMHGWIAGSEIRATTDGGVSWALQDQPAGVDPDTARSMLFFDEAHGYAVGDEGMLVHTADGGTTWERRQPELTRLAFLRLAAPNPRWLWAVGVNGMIARGHDPGAVVRPTGTPAPSVTPTRPPSPTARPTPTPTVTPTGPWVRVGDAGPLLVPPGTSVSVPVYWGNMPATVEIVAQVSGPLVFDNGAQELAWTASRSSGSGSVPVTVHAAADATAGTRFSLQVTVDGLPSGHPGTIAWQATLPWCGLRAIAPLD